MRPLWIRTEPITRHDGPAGALHKVWPRPVDGEVYVVDLLPAHPRGHHLHRKGGEWFVALSGRVILVVQDPDSGARAEVELSGLRARVEAGQAHALYAIGAPALVLALADVAHPAEDTVPWPVSPPRGAA